MDEEVQQTAAAGWPGEPRTADALSEFLANPTYEPGEVDPALLPPLVSEANPILVNTSLRLPLQIKTGVEALARARGTDPSKLMRQWIEAGYATATGPQRRVVDIADVIAALNSVPSAGRASA